MAQTRIVDLAKELRVQPSDVVAALAEMGIHLRSYNAVTLDDATARSVRKIIQTKESARAAAPKPPVSVPASEGIPTEAQPDASPRVPRRATRKAPSAEPPPAEPKAPPTVAPPPEPPREAKTIEIGDTITVRELAERLNQPVADVITRLVSMGHLATVNQSVQREVAAKVAKQYGFEVAAVARPVVPTPAVQRRTVVQRRVVTRPLQPRPPVVTVLGHVDHGKTTLLDAIRQTNVVAKEFGGITQHIGAYQSEVHTQDGPKRITFIDTPGHEAFTQMRARGAQVTDIVVLVVAADDGVMPQTVEAINHARAAKVPIIVAINKVDKEDANVERTKQQLMEHGLVPEEWGGETIMVEVSAKEKQGIDELLEMILLMAEMEELRADPGAPVQGTVIEAKLERGRGPVATVLVQEGTLKTGDTIVAGTTWGRIRAMTDDRGRKVNKAGPATPVEVIGLDSVPMAGDRIEVVKDEHEARALAESRLEALREQRAAEVRPRISLQDLFEQMAAGEVKEFNIILKADTQGSVEVLREALQKMEVPNEEVKLSVLHAAVGNVGESDIMLARASNAVVIGFNVRLDAKARKMAEDEHVDVRLYNVIYELLDDVKAALTGMLAPVFEEQILGHAEVRATFHAPHGVIAGCLVTDGRVVRGAEVRVLRNEEEIFRGRLTSLRHLKDDVREMAAGFECGMMLEGFNDFQEGDVIQCFTVEEVHRA